MVKEESTEQRILDAARKVFIRKGMTGARMQEVADEAGINKALLHYYFRSKQQLFEGVFQRTAQKDVACIWRMIEDESDLFTAIERFVNAYIDRMLEEPHLPQFIITELQRDPKATVKWMDKSKAGRAHFVDLVRKAQAAGHIIAVEPEELLINMMALCVHPFIARPILQHIHGLTDTSFQKLIKERRRTVPQFIIRSISNR